MKTDHWESIATWGAMGALAGGSLWFLTRPKKSAALPGLPADQYKPFPGIFPSTLPAEERPFGGNQKGIMIPETPCFPMNGFGAFGLTPDSCPMDPFFGFPHQKDIDVQRVAREAYILDQVKKGNFEANWVPILSVERLNDGLFHMARFWVLGDALKVNGVRVIANARLEQQIADILGARLLTPKIADLIYDQANIKLLPRTIPPTKQIINSQGKKVDIWIPPMNDTRTMITQHQTLDKAIRAAGGDPANLDGKIVSTIGKHWVLDNRLLNYNPDPSKPIDPNRGYTAENYGFHYPFKGTKVISTDGPSETLKGIYMYQTPGWQHNIDHDDYSQNVVLVHDKCRLDDKEYTLSQILVDPELSKFASHQGPLKLLRQPGVEQLPTKFGPPFVVI